MVKHRRLAGLSGHLVLVAALAGPSCTPPPPPEAPAAKVEAAPLPMPVAAPEPPSSYEPVAEPKGIASIARIGSPIADLVMLRDLLPPDSAFGQLAQLGPQNVAEVVFGSLGEHLDIAAPLDIVILKDRPSPLVASLVLRDLDGTRKSTAADFSFETASDGSVLVTPKRGAKHAGMLDQLSCSVLRGGDPPVDHLICAADPESVEIAGPYLARTLSRRPLNVGLHFEVPEAIIQEALNEETEKRKTKVEPAEDPSSAAGRRIGQEIIEKLGHDFKDLAVDMSIAPLAINATMNLRFRSVTSVLSLALVSNAGSTVAPAYWKLPIDADLAFYLPGAKPEAMRPEGAKIWNGFAEAIAGDDYPLDVAREVAAQGAKLVFTGGPWIVAHGPPAPLKPAAAQKAPAQKAPAQKTPADSAKQYREARMAAAGWLLFEVPEPSGPWLTGVHELMKLEASRAKRKVATGKGTPAPGKSGGESAPGAGKSAAPKKHEHDQTVSTTREVPVRPADGLPAGALHIVHHEMPNPDFKPEGGERALEAAYDVHIFIAGTATDTWIVMSENEALARAKLHEAMTGDADTLADRFDLAPLKDAPPGVVGFLSLRALVALSEDEDTTDQLAARTRDLKRVAGLPSSGKSPLLLSLAPKPSADKNGAVLCIAAALSLAGALDIVQWVH